MSEQETPQIEMPRYKCHKVVHALKIKRISYHYDSTATLYPADERYAPIKVDTDFIKKHDMESEGYYVVYADGYKSYSPEKPFEEGYTLITGDQGKDEELSASEALYSFVSWLTTRKELVAFGSSLDAAPAAQLVSAFVKIYGLPEPRPDWHKRIIPIPNINNDGDVVTADADIVEGTDQL